MAGEFLAFGYELYVGAGTTSSTYPTSVGSLVKVYNLTNAPLAGTSNSTSILDYDSDPGWTRDRVTSVGYSLPITTNFKPSDPGYRILKEAFEEAPNGAAAQFWLKTPVKDGSGDDAEIHAGVATVTAFDPGNTVGETSTMGFTLTGFGQLKWWPQGNPIATLTVTTAGSGLTAATYEDVVLIGGSGNGATADIVVAAGGTVTSAPTIILGGRNYVVGDVLQVALASVGGSGADVAPTFTVATVS